MPDEQPEKLDLTSMDIAARKRRELKQLFPEVFAEARKADGAVVEAVDFERLKTALGEFSDILERQRERYGMTWPGKNECQKIIQQPSLATLKPDRSESVNFDETENLFIEGDNLEVLKLLQKSYYGKVKMIYIDPPYNTGNDFVYPDDYSESLDTYLRYAGLADEEGKKWESKVNAKDSARFHTQWLNMMYPRLYLARNLLKEDGVLFISIDDGEVSNLRKILDEVFGEENFINTVVWEKRYSPQNAVKWFSESHDFILVYAKNKLNWFPNLLERSEEMNARYRNIDGDPRGVWKPADSTAQAGHGTENQFYTFTAPNGKRHSLPNGRCWVYTRPVMEEMVLDNRIWFGSDGNNVPAIKRFLSEVKQGTACQTIWKYSDVGHNQEGKKEINSLITEATVFETSKPSRLIKRILHLATDSDSIVLDFFSGSSSTAQATLEKNQEDGGNRKFIMVQLPEPCPEDSEAAKAGFKTIADIGKERIRRVIKKIESEQEGQLNLKDKPKPDLGFKVFKLDRSNFKVWDSEPKDDTEAIKKQIELQIDHIDPEASQEDILYELLLKAGFPLTTKIEKRRMVGKDVFAIEDGALLICLEKSLTPELIRAMAESNPRQVICLDEGFEGNDQLKTNAVQTFKSRSQGDSEHPQIVFRTV